MKKYFTCLYLPLLSLFLPVIVHAQQPAPQLIRDTVKQYKPRLISALAELQGDSVVVRWSPGDAALWLAGKTGGYVIKRFTVDTANKKLYGEMLLTEVPLRPWTVIQFKAIFEKTNDTLLAAAAEVVYNNTAAMSTKNVNAGDLSSKAGQQNDLRLYGQLIACFSPACAKAMGLSFVDKTAQKGKEYLYQICLAANSGIKSGDTCFAVINTAEPSIPMQMPNITAIPMDRAAQFVWNKDVYSSNFVAFVIERSDDGGKTFHQTRKLPIIEMAGARELRMPERESVIRDSLPQNYVSYQFRLKGINAFGDRSIPSNVVTVTGQYRIAPLPATVTAAQNITGNLVKIDWKLLKPSAAIAGYLVGKGSSHEGPFSPLGLDLIKPAAPSFTDSFASPNEENYYVVTTFDTAGNFSNSYPYHVNMKDSMPPDAPAMATGSIDSTGHINITWNRPKAPDVAGYMIQRANALNHNFVPVSQVSASDTTFADSITLKTLTRHIYYRVIAFDRVRNTSQASNIVDITKPDIVPPVPSVFTNYVTSDISIRLYWNKSTSEDLSKQYLYRKTGAAAWEQVAVMNNIQVMFTDTTMHLQTMYTYQVISEDSAGLKSQPSFPLSAQTFAVVKKNTDGEIKAILQPDSTAIKIEWEVKGNTPPANILLYRSVNGGAFSMYANIPAPSSSYIDKHITTGNTYGYSFKYMYDGNSESLLSKPATIAVNK